MNIWLFQWFLLKVLWDVGARQSKKCSTKVTVFWWTVSPGSTNYFLMKPSGTLMINPVFQNKIWVTWTKWRTLLFGRVKRSYLNHAGHLKNAVLLCSGLMSEISFKGTQIRYYFLKRRCSFPISYSNVKHFNIRWCIDNSRRNIRPNSFIKNVTKVNWQRCYCFKPKLPKDPQIQFTKAKL